MLQCHLIVYKRYETKTTLTLFSKYSSLMSVDSYKKGGNRSAFFHPYNYSSHEKQVDVL